MSYINLAAMQANAEHLYHLRTEDTDVESLALFLQSILALGKYVDHLVNLNALRRDQVVLVSLILTTCCLYQHLPHVSCLSSYIHTVLYVFV